MAQPELISFDAELSAELSSLYHSWPWEGRKKGLDTSKLVHFKKNLAVVSSISCANSWYFGGIFLG